MIDLIRFRNLCSEASHLVAAGQLAKASILLDQAKAIITPRRIPYIGPPELDPNRTEADRAAWAHARGNS